MSHDEQDRLVGAAHRRHREARRSVVCLRSKLDKMARDYRRLADLLPDGGIVEHPEGYLALMGVNSEPPLNHPDERTLLDTLAEYADAKRELEQAENEWSALTSPQ